jgi:hypothetical protein
VTLYEVSFIGELSRWSHTQILELTRDSSLQGTTDLIIHKNSTHCCSLCSLPCKRSLIMLPFLFCVRQGPGTWFTAVTNSLDKHLEWIDLFVPDEIYFMGCSNLGILRAYELCKQSRQTSGMNWLICSWWDLFYGLQQSWHLESIWTLQNSLDKHLDWSDWVFSFVPDEIYRMGCSNLGILRAIWTYAQLILKGWNRPLDLFKAFITCVSIVSVQEQTLTWKLIA